MCNKLASRHVRVGLADPSDVARCDICENAPAFFYCEIDGSSLCLQCDMNVHVGGKRTHGRYLLFRQKVEFPGHKPSHLEDLSLQPMEPDETRREQSQPPKLTTRESLQNHSNNDDHGKMITEMFDLNTRPNRVHGQASSIQGMNFLNVSNEESVSIALVRSSKGKLEK